jgi:hypothetical protein
VKNVKKGSLVERKRLTEAFEKMSMASVDLQKAAEQLAEFGSNVPSLNADALKMMLDTIKSLDTSLGFIKSFVRVSTLQQIVKER